MVNCKDNMIILLSYIYQYGVLLYAIFKCLKEDKKNIFKWVATYIVCISIIIILNFWLKNRVMVIIEIHSVSFFMVCGITKKEKIYDAMYAHSLCYYGCLIYSLVQDTLFGVKMTFDLKSIIVGIFFMAIYLYSVEGLAELFDIIRNEEQYRTFVIIISFITDIFLIFDEIVPESQIRMLQLTVSIMCFMFLGFYIVYCVIRYWKVRKIVQINANLNCINNELRKIKESHSRVINLMYEFYKEKENEEIGFVLKSIINNENNEVKANKIEEKKNDSILDMISMGAIKDGIEVNIDEKYSVELVCMDKMELYRIITNIVNNARRVLRGSGVINIKTRKKEDNIMITIDNNGPEIDERYIKKIFQAGFTTQNNNDKSHGYGLNIVKELIEKNCGQIDVESSEKITVFKIVLPCN